MVARGGRPRILTAATGGASIEAPFETHGVGAFVAESESGLFDVLVEADPHCVVLGDGFGAPDAVGLAAEIRQRDTDVPIVLALEGPLDGRAEAAIEAGVAATGRLREPEALVETAVEEARAYREAADERERTERDAIILDALLSNLPLSIYVKDGLHRHLRVSDAMICAEDPDLYLENDEGKAHQHPDDLLGKTDFDIFGPDSEAAIEDDERVMETEEAILDRIEESRTRLGEDAFYSTSKAPWYDDGEVAGVVGVTVDVSERMRARRDLEQQNERLEEFASMVSHDLRNPLSVLSGYLEVLQEGHDETALEHCEDSIERMEELIEEILAYARHGRAVVDPDLVDLETVARAAWENVDTPDATLEIDVELPVRADRPRLQRILENCFRNSIEHGDDDVVVRVADDGTDFYVADDGPGIDPDRRDVVFERGVTSSDDGTGFGLATVRTIAEAHGWEVGIENCPEGGARVHFTGVARADLH